MKARNSITAAVSFLLLSILACAPFTVSTPTTAPTQQPPPEATVTPTLPSMPTDQAPTSTVEAPTDQPVLEPQSAAPPRLPPGSRIQLDEIHMTNLSEGWGISAGLLLATADGGKTWREVTPNVAGAYKIYGAFLDQQTAWVILSPGDQIVQPLTIYFTKDGGSTWSTNSEALTLTTAMGDSTWAEFAVLDARNLWVMVRGVYVGAGTHYTHELFHSADGGVSWTSLGGETSDDYTGMAFADTAFGLRSLQTIGFYGPGAPAFDVTIDGGATWEGRELPAPPDAPDLFSAYPYCETYQPVLLSAQEISMLVGCFDDRNPPQEFNSYLYSSQDGGNTWTTTALPEGVLASTDSLIYMDANNALLLGKTMYKSADGGQTWSYIQEVTWDGQFSFIDPLHGWGVVWGGGLMALVDTSDGGKYWAEIKPVTGK
jgi:photosystem II stability/assembly factor-like uncharacterized protein